ncbi:MAG: hypothetical protein KGP01_04770 [Actinomycetales bacterium]|nr:hypothetical protein [Actinomycetales bacterium]
MSQPIVANSVLPARREPVTLRTSDGLSLVAELALPEKCEPVATMLCLHPLPTHGGMMDSHVFRKAAWRLPALADISVLRWNTRGTTSPAGTSEGQFEGGAGEGLDLAAAVAFAQSRGLPNIWLVGWSFGTDVTLRHGLLRGVAGAILLSPPLRWTDADDLARWAAAGTPLVCLVPEFDDYLRPADAAVRFAAVPQAEVIGVSEAKHLWVGEAAVSHVLDEVVARLAPGRSPLPREWDGPMERWSDL